MKRCIYFLGVIVFLMSCNKDNTDYYDLLTSKMWLTRSITINPEYHGTTDGFRSVRDYEKDNLYRYKTNGELWLDEGELKREESDPQQKKIGVWRLDGSTLYIKYNDRTTENELSIEDIDGNKAIMVVSAGGYTSTYVYQAKDIIN